MRNLNLYGIAKVNDELRARVVELERLPSEGEKAARMMAWNSFVEDQVELGENLEVTKVLARMRYQQLEEMVLLDGAVMDIDSETFTQYFFDELWVVNKKVTKKSVQIVFYLFVALGLFGLYKIFF